MNEHFSGHLEQDGLAGILDLGFVPDVFEIFTDDGTNPDKITWFKEMESLGTPEYGFLTTGSTGDITKLSTAATGIIAYDASTLRVLLPAPDGNGKAQASIADYNTATTYTARSASALGSVVRPTTHNGLVYECTTASGGAAGTEPTFPTRTGQSVTSGSGDVWIARDEEVLTDGVKGVQLGASLSQNTNGNEAWFIATKSDFDRDKGDAGAVAAGNPI